MSRQTVRCAVCDEWYPVEQAKDHLHAEPQSGPIRTAWLASKLSWPQFMKQCKQAFQRYTAIHREFDKRHGDTKRKREEKDLLERIEKKKRRS